MATPTDILTLTQWFSPAFPVGAFAYSHGLEQAVESGAVTDTNTTRGWLETALRHGAGWNDAIFLAEAHRAEGADALAMLDATCRAFAASRERLEETQRQGEAFCAAVSDGWGLRISQLTYPVAAGRAARLHDLPLPLTIQVFLQAFLSNLSGAAMRLVPLGQSEGQALIRDLTPACVEIADRAVTATLDDLSSSAYLTDIAAMKHETQYSRIFRT